MSELGLKGRRRLSMPDSLSFRTSSVRGQQTLQCTLYNSLQPACVPAGGTVPSSAACPPADAHQRVRSGCLAAAQLLKALLKAPENLQQMHEA